MPRDAVFSTDGAHECIAIESYEVVTVRSRIGAPMVVLVRITEIATGKKAQAAERLLRGDRGLPFVLPREHTFPRH